MITVPVYFNDIQRSQLKQCYQKVGFNVIRIINEPNAAILSYIYHQDSTATELILVIDCGGGTTDMSLIEVDTTDMIFEVKNVCGDNYLGGEDITNNIVNYIIDKLLVKYNLDIDLLNQKQLNQIKQECEIAKKHLSYNLSYALNINDNWVINLSRSEILSINYNFFERIKKNILETVDNQTQTLNKIIFVGGSTRIPYFKTICRNIFGDDIEIKNELDPDQTISIGAAIQGALLSFNIDDTNKISDSLLLDIVPLSLGIETSGGLMSTIISKNSVIPANKTILFTNSDDYIDSITINIYQGQRKFIKDNTYLTSFELTDLDKTLQKGQMKISINFDINYDGILNVTAETISKYNNIKKNIIVNQYVAKQNEVINLDFDEILKIQD